MRNERLLSAAVRVGYDQRGFTFAEIVAHKRQPPAIRRQGKADGVSAQVGEHPSDYLSRCAAQHGHLVDRACSSLFRLDFGVINVVAVGRKDEFRVGS